MLARRLEALVDRFFAADHGLLRLRFAARTVSSLGLALLVLVLLGFSFKVLLIGAITGMFTSVTLRTGTGKQRAAFIVMFLAVMVASLTAATLLGPYRFVGDAVFVVVMFLAVYLRRFAQLGFGLGMGMFMSFFFGTFLKLSPSALPQVYPAMCIGAACCALLTFTVFRETPQSMLRRATVSTRAQLARLIEELVDVLESRSAPPEGVELPRPVARQTERLHATTLAVEDYAADIGLTEAWQRQLVDTELAADRLARAVVRAARDEPAPDTRRALIDDLRGLHRFIDRDPAAAMGIDEDELLLRIARYDIRGDPSQLPSDPEHHTLIVHRAIRELLLSIVRIRRISLRVLNQPRGERSRLAAGDTADTGKASTDANTAETDEAEETESTTAPAAGGLAPTTRSALQAVLGGALALTGGDLLSQQRWYWAVLSGFVVFAGTTSRGDLLLKGWRRVWGTIVGIVLGTVLGTVLHGDTVVNLVVLLVCVFLAFYSLRASYGLMTLFITMMLSMLYDIMGKFSGGVLVLRLEETAIGVASSGIAAMILLPRRTSSAVMTALHDYLEALRVQVDNAQRLLIYREPVALLASTREVDRAADTVRTTIQPMLHPMSPARDRRGQANRVRNLVDESATAARNLARAAEPGSLAGLPAGIRTLHRLVANLDALAAATAEDPEPGQLRSGAPLAPQVDVRALAAVNNEGVPNRISVLHLRRTINALDRLDKVLLGLGSALEQQVTVPLDREHHTDTHPAIRSA